jgi:hypothetical protein
LADEFEQREKYQELLDEVLTRSVAFQATLGKAQLERWLALEEAFLELGWWLHGEYFRAGFELGRYASRRASSPHPGTAPQLAQAELVFALSRLLRGMEPR